MKTDIFAVVPHPEAAAPTTDRSVSPELLSQLSRAAADEEQGKRSISQSIELLRSDGLLGDDGSGQPDLTARALMRVGAANLSVGRLWEGHINALCLVNRYGSGRMRRAVGQMIEDKAFLGVWGADGDVPVTWQMPDDHLAGGKNFASGLGTVTHAIVTVNSGAEVRLALIDVSDRRRGNPAAWDMEGMKATASGRYDFDGMPIRSVDWIGEPGDYLREPHFVGGVWRIAALQVGAALGLLDRAAAQLRSNGRIHAEAQTARLMAIVMRAWAGMSVVERVAKASVRPGHSTERIVSLSISARLLTEEISLDAIRAVEQSLGLRHFAAGSETGRIARDLSVYTRQAARDAFLQRAGTHALGQDDAIWGIFG